MYKKNLIWAAFALLTLFSAKANEQRWKIADDGSIYWTIGADIPHTDHIEMSGKSVSVVLRYGVNSQGAFTLNKSMVWPLLRTIP
ncbi:MAG: hypothetical protein VB075_10270, partial [Petrimonas sp.]|nr:hypothetical protein [Petrimonas sp.]